MTNIFTNPQTVFNEMIQRVSTADSTQEEIDGMRQGLEMMSATTTGIIDALRYE